MKKALMKALAVSLVGKKSLRTSSLLLTGLVLLLGSASAGDANWTSRGLQGRAISSLVVDPSSPSRIYAAAGAEGIYASSDGGENWNRLDFGRAAQKLAIDDRNPDTLYAIEGTRGGQLYRSLDRGRTWATMNLEALVFSVAVNPKETGVVHAGLAGANVSTSRDGGGTWSNSNFAYYCSDICMESITSLALDPSSPSTMYAGIDADFDYPGFADLFKSTDGGKTWKESDAGIVLWSSVYSIAVDPVDSQRILAGASGYSGSSPGTYLSVDAGQIWRRAFDSASRAFAFDPWNPLVIYAGTDHEGVM